MIYFGKEDIMIKCIGCGSILQDEFPLKEGYTRDLNNRFCERCFNIKHYNKYLKVSNKDYSEVIKKIDSNNDLVLLVTDFLNLYNLDEINLKSPVILVISKADIIPRSVNKEKLLSNIKSNLNIVYKLFISSKNNYNFDLLYENILRFKQSKDVYVIGYTNAGKSTLVNKMIKNYGGGNGNITVSNLPSTTLDLIYNKVNDDLNQIATPGLLDNGSMILDASKEVLNKITPKKEIRPISYQIKGWQSLLIETFVRLDLENTNIICFMSNNLSFRRVYKDKECTLVKHDLVIKKNSDLVIKGLGFISFKKDSKVTFWLLDGINYIIRDSII